MLHDAQGTLLGTDVSSIFTIKSNNETTGGKTNVKLHFFVDNWDGWKIGECPSGPKLCLQDAAGPWLVIALTLQELISGCFCYIELACQCLCCPDTCCKQCLANQLQASNTAVCGLTAAYVLMQAQIQGLL